MSRDRAAESVEQRLADAVRLYVAAAQDHLRASLGGNGSSDRTRELLRQAHAELEDRLLDVDGRGVFR